VQGTATRGAFFVGAVGGEFRGTSGRPNWAVRNKAFEFTLTSRIIPATGGLGRNAYSPMNTISKFILTLLASLVPAFSAEPLYKTDFEATDVGGEPEGFLVIDGQFAVREFAGGKVFELPGSPLESFGFLFGPNFSFNDAGTRFKTSASAGAQELAGVVVSARAHGTKQGRRFPTFSVGLCGVSGYKLRVAPMKRALELVRGDETVASLDFDWPSGEWTRLKLQVRVADGQWIAEGKAWAESATEPADWQVTHASADRPNPGRPSAWAAPFSGQPIRFDDLLVEAGGQ
jgi:hypothetical protein